MTQRRHPDPVDPADDGDPPLAPGVTENGDSRVQTESTHVAYFWREIDDYRVDPQSLARPELRHLSMIWTEQREALRNEAGMKAFNARLRREWAIETGLLERVYTLDRGIMRLLVERGIEASLMSHASIKALPRRALEIIRDHETAFEDLHQFVQSDRPLTTTYIRELHRILMRNASAVRAVNAAGQEVRYLLVPGQYKTDPNNPVRRHGVVHEFAPPEFVVPQMERLVDLHAAHGDTPPEVEGAWLHHRFTQIHPFPDGNGRIARCLTSLVFLRAGWFPLVVRDTKDERRAYLDALAAADFGDLAPLVNLFALAQKRAFVQALGISGEVLKLNQSQNRPRPPDLRVPPRSAVTDEQRADNHRTADALLQTAVEHFKDLRTTITVLQVKLFPTCTVTIDHEPDGGSRSHFYERQVFEMAQVLDYTPNPSDYHAWARIVLLTHTHMEFVVSIHGSGHQYRGVLAASICCFVRRASSEGPNEITELRPLSDEIFQFNYRETEATTKDRFSDWLEAAIFRGLDRWSRVA